jgi:hypothetical protein
MPVTIQLEAVMRVDRLGNYRGAPILTGVLPKDALKFVTAALIAGLDVRLTQKSRKSFIVEAGFYEYTPVKQDCKGQKT